MSLKTGEMVSYRPALETRLYAATLTSVDETTIRIETEGAVPALAKGQNLIVSDADFDYHTEVVDVKGNTVQLKQKETERREYFRVDDVLPLTFRKIRTALPFRKSKLLSGLSAPLHFDETPDETPDQRLWKLLVEINTKLSLIIDRLSLESEGLTRAENKQVNLSASGIRFTAKEKFELGDLIEVKLIIPNRTPVGMLVYGHVVRLHELSGGEYEIGINFVDMDEEVRNAITQYALNRQRELIRKERGYDV